ncbi:MaoC family dehydratase N-terminal domain-containing protein [Isoptericola sp. NPDC019571]|uniref:FAS1-like dehydratase domain-containing protein n=1 Tax=Isoptericola sp. NPDC019571 TaxID=3364008 RepID=UPI0037AA3666
MANPDFAGREYPATAPYSVGREKLREFASAVGAAHPAHHDLVAARGLGYPDLVAPPTFAVVVAQRAEAQYVQDPDAGIDFSRVVHADEKFTHHRPIVAGDELVTVLHVDSVTERAGIAMVTTRCEILAAADGAAGDGAREPVATVSSSLVIRGEDS